MHDPVSPPDPVLTKQRWINHETREWVKECDEILTAHGVVTSQHTYAKRHIARHRARKLIRLMTELRIHDRWELVEHTERRGEEYGWAVELVPSKNQSTKHHNE